MIRRVTVDERRKMVLSGNIVRTLLFLSFPTIMMSFVSALIPLTDGLFLNRTSGYVIAAAIGYDQQIINILIATSMGLGAAAMSYLGQINGSGDMKLVKKAAMNILVFSFIISLLIVPLTIFVASFAKNMVNAEISESVFVYLSAYSLVIPFLFMSSIYNSIKNAFGQPEATLIRMVILFILKISFNAIFLYVLKLKLIGAVMSSFASYLIVGIWMIYDLFIKETETKLTFKNFRFDYNIIKKIIKIAIPSILSYIMINLAFFLINTEVEKYGTIVLTAQTISGNINNMCFTLPSSISTSIATMVSINIGANQVSNAKKTHKIGCVFSVILSLILIVIFYPSSEFLARLFQDNEEIVRLTVHSLDIYTFSIIGFAIFMVTQGAFIGMGKTKYVLLFGILRLWLIRYLFILVTKKYLGVDSVFWGNLLSNYLAGFLFLLLSFKIKWTSAIKN